VPRAAALEIISTGAIVSTEQSQPSVHKSAPTPPVWVRPTLIELPALRDLTLQSGIAGTGSSSGGLSFP
jgi:hypothetical protein